MVSEVITAILTHTQSPAAESTAEIEFYTECAELEGLTLEQWMAKEPF